MICKRVKLALISYLIVFCQSTSADTFDPVTDGAQIPFQTVGEARLRVFFFDVYDSKLSTPTGAYEPGQRPVKLEITYLRAFKASSIVQQTIKEWRHLGVDPEQYERYLTAIDTLWPDLEKGDTLVFVVYNDESNEFFHNDRSLGRVNQPSFAQDFLAIWLSPNTSQPELRAQLIGEESCYASAC
jgi:hypothetical protein